MKKIVCISLCVLLCVPLLALSAFADNSNLVNCTFTAVSNFTFRLYTLDSSTVFSEYSQSVSSLSFSLSCDDVHSFTSTGYMGSESSQRNLALYYNDSLVSYDSSSPTLISYTSSASFECRMTSTANPQYFVIESPPPDPLAPVNDGVDLSISFTGQVLTFLTSNSTTIFLIGLSVAMFAVLPYGIRKIKQLIKGY